jgi:hypothetical protein
LSEDNHVGERFQMKIWLVCIAATVVLMPDLSAIAVGFVPQSIEVRNASQAFDKVLFYLQGQNNRNAPNVNLKWKDRTIYSGGPIDLTTTSKQFTADDWIIEVSQGLAPIRNTIYRVTVFNSKYGWHWSGSVKADGSVIEDSPFRLMSDEDKRKLADEFATKRKIPAPHGGYGH